MHDDITDAARWLIQSDLADPAHVCIVGASYGGYAALLGAAKEPDLYRCAVSIAVRAISGIYYSIWTKTEAANAGRWRYTRV